MNQQKIRSILIKLSLALSLFIPLWFALAAKGSYWEWWSWRTGFGLTMTWGIRLTIVALALAVLSLLCSVVIKPRRVAAMTLIALAIPIGVLVYANYVKTHVGRLPFIHDVSTDIVNPPQLSNKLLALRGEQSNPAHYVGKKDPLGKELVSVLQQQGYPDIKTINLFGSVAEVRLSILRVIDQFGWQLQSDDRQTGIIEATEKTFWFGFLDDVVIRVQPNGDQTQVDIRSISRIGGSDMGKNAARIRRLSNALSAP